MERLIRVDRTWDLASNCVENTIRQVDLCVPFTAHNAECAEKKRRNICGQRDVHIRAGEIARLLQLSINALQNCVQLVADDFLVEPGNQIHPQ